MPPKEQPEEVKDISAMIEPGKLTRWSRTKSYVQRDLGKARALLAPGESPTHRRLEFDQQALGSCLDEATSAALALVGLVGSLDCEQQPKTDFLNQIDEELETLKEDVKEINKEFSIRIAEIIDSKPVPSPPPPMDPVPQRQTGGAAKLKISEFSKSDAGFWFKRLELEFSRQEIRSEKDKFSCLMSELANDEMVTGLIRHFLDADVPEGSYTQAKEILIRNFGLTVKGKLTKALNIEPRFDEERPSALVERLKFLLREPTADDLALFLLVRKLPPQTQTLVADVVSVDELGKRLDQLMNTNPSLLTSPPPLESAPSQLMAVSSPAKPQMPKTPTKGPGKSVWKGKGKTQKGNEGGKFSLCTNHEWDPSVSIPCSPSFKGKCVFGKHVKSGNASGGPRRS